MAVPESYQDKVFVNCPFDDEYKPLFDADVFCIHDAGFIAHCALEISDSSQNRLSKILSLIGDCKYGLHDISRVGLDVDTSLPRFNMPLELGIFLECKALGNRTHQAKSCLVLDSDPYRYRSSMSDVAGQEIAAHHNDVRNLIQQVRRWLTTASKRRNSHS